MEHEADPTVLRAIAHPVRNRVLAELFAGGPLRAADVAALIDVPANQASFHLRQLAKYGLVEEAPELARDGRDRVWRLTDADGVRLHVDEMEMTPEGKAALSVWRRQSSAAAHELIERAYAPASGRPKDTHVSISENSLHLTKKEAQQVTEELGEVVGRWRDKTAGKLTEGRRTYLLFEILQPYPEAKAGTST
jgi:DNA-binding transcriptional ArsR family regulator